MKSPKTEFKNALRKIFYQYIFFTLGLACFVFLAKHIFFTQQNYSIYNKSLPGESIISSNTFKSEVYFNTVLGDTTFLDRVVDLIDNSKETIEIAMFSFDSNKVKDAIYRAHKRGVKVTLVLDKSRSEKHSTVFFDLPKDIKRIDIGEHSTSISTENIYMHHKFLIVDRHNDISRKLLTGSMDFTSKGEKYEQSFYIITPDKVMIETYGKVFNILANGVYSTKKLEDLNYNPWALHAEYSDSYIDIWLSPGFKKHSLKYTVIKNIQNATIDIKVAMWQFNDKDIAKALIDQAKKGVKVYLITDDLVADKENSVVPFLKNQIEKYSLKNFTVVLDTKSKEDIDETILGKNFNPFIHHHYMIVDGKIVIAGTNNWTHWGFYQNDEDTIVTNNDYLVSEFNQNFTYFLKILK